MEEPEELKDIDNLISELYPDKRSELLSVDKFIKYLAENNQISPKLNTSINDLYNKLIDTQRYYLEDKIKINKLNKIIKEQEEIIKSLQNVPVPISINKVNDEMERMYALVQKVYNKMTKISSNLNDPANVKMKNALNNILLKGTQTIYGLDYQNLIKTFGYSSPSKTIFFDNVFLATTQMAQTDLDEFKLSYRMLFFDVDDVPSKLRDLLEDALGSVQVFVKLKVNKNINNELITIDQNNISIDVSDNKTQNISVNCYNGVIPEEYNRISTLDIAENKASNKVLFNSLSSKIDLALKNYNIICFGSGYSGAGKTYTLLKGNNSIIKEIYQKYGDIYTLKLSVFEQYGYLDIQNDTLLGEIFSVENIKKNNKKLFTEHLYVYDLVNIKDVEIKGNNKINKLDTYLNDNNYSVVINNVDNVLDQIEIIRKSNGRIKFTINNPESSRSHIYYLIKIIGPNSNILGYVTIIDMGGQENPREIFLDFMGGSKFLFDNYFGILYDNKVYINKKLFVPLSDLYAKKTVYGIFDYYRKNIINTPLENQFNIITQLIDENSAYGKFFPSITHKWFYLSFYYPVELFLLIKFYSQDLNKTSLKSYYGLSNKDIFIQLGNKEAYKEIYCSLRFLKETMNAFVKRIKSQYNDLNMDENNLNNLFIARSIFETFLEGFYINETLVNKMKILKSEQMIPITSQKYKNIQSNDYDPFIGMNIKTLTNNIFDYLSRISGSQSNGARFIKYIEIACIRADVAQSATNQSLTNISNQQNFEGILCTVNDLGLNINNQNYKYKYAIASCVTLKASAMLSGAQCPIDKFCSNTITQTGGSPCGTFGCQIRRNPYGTTPFPRCECISERGSIRIHHTADHNFYYRKYIKYKLKYLMLLSKLSNIKKI